MSGWKDELNNAQREAVLHDGPPLIVLAGPGTGKTRTIIARIRRLVEEGADPEGILALVFGNKAAAEIRERLAPAIGAGPAERLRAVTFHSFGRGILQRFGDMIGFRDSAAIADSAQVKRLLRSLMRQHGLFKEREPGGLDTAVADAVRFIAACRHAARTHSDALAFARTLRVRSENSGATTSDDQVAAAREEARVFEEHARLFSLFEQACLRDGLIGFDDFLGGPLRLFAEHETVARIIRAETPHVLVDEFQDVNAAQIRLLRHLFPPGPPRSGRSLCVVGDDDQAIYAFRGSDTHAFERFRQDWPGSRTVALTENYRSAPAIVAVANTIIRGAGHRFGGEKDLRSSGDAAAEPGTVEAVITEIDRGVGLPIAAMLLAASRERPEVPWSEYGVLVRSHSVRDEIVAELELHGIPVAAARRPSPLDSEAVKDALEWAKLTVDPLRDSAAARLLLRPPFSMSLSELERHKRAHEIARAEGERTGLAERISAAAEADPAARMFADRLAELRVETAREPAHRMIERLVREAAAAVEAFSPRARAAEISSLVELLRFARDRQPVLEPPGDLNSLLRHIADLDPEDRRLRPPSLSDLEADNEGADQTGGVRVLTAHAAKGLEFDTVFIARTRPGPAGFPSSIAERRGLPLPEEFTGSPAPAPAEEERRLFYVACTRAKRRLVLLAKSKKTRTKTTDYLIELQDATPPTLNAVRAASEVIASAGPTVRVPSAAETEPDPADADRPAAIVRRETERVRREAFIALHDALNSIARRGAGPTLDECREQLSGAAGKLAVLGVLATGGAWPAELPRGVDPTALEHLRSALSNHEPSIAQPLVPPLRLSYTQIHAYLECPRCFYLRFVRKLPEPPTIELAVGALVHESLHEFVEIRRRAEAEGSPPPSLETLHSIAAKRHRQSWPSTREYDDEPLLRARAMLGLYHQRLEDGANVLELERTVRFPYRSDAGDEHEMVAKLDRLDQTAGNRLRLVDYKTGKLREDLLEPKADDLQLCIYAMALRHLLGLNEDEAAPANAGELSGTAEYWILSEGVRGVIELGALDLSGARRTIDAAVSGMLAGNFGRSKKCTNDLCAALDMNDS